MNTIVVGGGAAGLMAALTAVRQGDSVTILERNEKAGKKIYITGKGRCNLTNMCAPRDFLANVVTNAKFLSSAIYAFSPEETRLFFQDIGLPTKIERGNRVFPLSDKASDVTKVLLNAFLQSGGKIIYNTKVININIKDKFILSCIGQEYTAEKIILACGGASYSITGSDGNGYDIAKKLGHTIIKPKPALVPFILKEDVSSLQGLSLKNVDLTVKSGKISKTERGEMLFTQKGISGPLVLTMSSFFNRKSDITASIDLKPALDKNTLDKRVLTDFAENANKQLKNALFALLPKRIIPFIIDYARIDEDKPVNLVTKDERERLVDSLKNLTFTVDRTEDLDYAIITSGGVDVTEVNPRTMESKKIKGLYFAGEILDVDALTGGYNLQIAWSTGRLAGGKHGD